MDTRDFVLVKVLSSFLSRLEIFPLSPKIDLETEEKMRTYISSSSSSIIICIWNSEKLHIPGHFPLVIAMNLQFDILFPPEVFLLLRFRSYLFEFIWD